MKIQAILLSGVIILSTSPVWGQSGTDNDKNMHGRTSTNAALTLKAQKRVGDCAKTNADVQSNRAKGVILTSETSEPAKGVVLTSESSEPCVK